MSKVILDEFCGEGWVVSDTAGKCMKLRHRSTVIKRRRKSIMVILKSMKKTEDNISTDYYPEGKELKGFMKIRIIDQEIIEHEKSGYSVRESRNGFPFLMEKIEESKQHNVKSTTRDFANRTHLGVLGCTYFCTGIVVQS